jgi:hypothetical protein
LRGCIRRTGVAGDAERPAIGVVAQLADVAGLVAEQLTVEQRIGQAAAIQRDEILRLAGAEIMQAALHGDRDVP